MPSRRVGLPLPKMPEVTLPHLEAGRRHPWTSLKPRAAVAQEGAEVQGEPETRSLREKLPDHLDQGLCVLVNESRVT